MNHSKTTLGELLSHSNETIKRNAMSILKTLQKNPADDKCAHCGEDMYTTIRAHHHTEINDKGQEVDVTKKPNENTCNLCNTKMDVFGRCKCCNKDAKQ